MLRIFYPQPVVDLAFNAPPIFRLRLIQAYIPNDTAFSFGGFVAYEHYQRMVTTTSVLMTPDTVASTAMRNKQSNGGMHTKK